MPRGKVWVSQRPRWANGSQDEKQPRRVLTWADHYRLQLNVSDLINLISLIWPWHGPARRRACVILILLVTVSLSVEPVHSCANDRRGRASSSFAFPPSSPSRLEDYRSKGHCSW